MQVKAFWANPSGTEVPLGFDRKLDEIIKQTKLISRTDQTCLPGDLLFILFWVAEGSAISASGVIFRKY